MKLFTTYHQYQLYCARQLSVDNWAFYRELKFNLNIFVLFLYRFVVWAEASSTSTPTSSRTSTATVSWPTCVTTWAARSSSTPSCASERRRASGLSSSSGTSTWPTPLTPSWLRSIPTWPSLVSFIFTQFYTTRVSVGATKESYCWKVLKVLTLDLS